MANIPVKMIVLLTLVVLVSRMSEGRVLIKCEMDSDESHEESSKIDRRSIDLIDSGQSRKDSSSENNTSSDDHSDSSQSQKDSSSKDKTSSNDHSDSSE
nr:dentin sialophosphoprotein-like [Misgurnus anguillicaudatus]